MLLLLYDDVIFMYDNFITISAPPQAELPPILPDDGFAYVRTSCLLSSSMEAYAQTV